MLMLILILHLIYFLLKITYECWLFNDIKFWIFFLKNNIFIDISFSIKKLSSNIIALIIILNLISIILNKSIAFFKLNIVLILYFLLTLQNKIVWRLNFILNKQFFRRRLSGGKWRTKILIILKIIWAYMFISQLII
jgi:hypothetical protein